MSADVYFEVRAVNGITVRTTVGYWGKIVTFKHPVMNGREEDVKATIQSPDEIRQSVRDENVLLYYRKCGYHNVCAVVRVAGQEGFIVTTYITDRIKEGRRLWTK